MRIKVPALALLMLAGCSDPSGRNDVDPTQNSAAAPEPAPTPEELEADANMADRAAEAEALDAEIGGNNSGADANLQ